MLLRYLWALIVLGRPMFLVGGFLAYGLGGAVAWHEVGTLDGAVYLAGQAAVTAIHWMTHYINEYWDLETDALTPMATPFSGGSRVLVAGQVPRHVAFYVGLFFLAAAVPPVAWLVLTRGAGTLTIPLFALGAAISWFYSSPPLRLSGRGLGELATAANVVVLAPQVGYYLQRASLSMMLLLIGLVLVPLQVAMMLTVEFPDLEADAATGKRTLVVRLGPVGAAWLHRLLLVAAGLGLLLALEGGLPLTVGRLLWLALLVGTWSTWIVHRYAHGRRAPERHQVSESVSENSGVGVRSNDFSRFLLADARNRRLKSSLRALFSSERNLVSGQWTQLRLTLVPLSGVATIVAGLALALVGFLLA